MRMRLPGWILMMFTSTMIAVVASRYLLLDPATYFEEQKAVYVRREAILFMHVAGSLTALLVGPWQFATHIRRRHIRLHRFVGLVYSAGCVVGGTAGIALATTAHGGAVATAGFMLLGGFWLATTCLALLRIHRLDVVGHRRWMVRSFSLCFAAVTLRLYLGIFGGLEAADLSLGVTFADAYVMIAWLCWVPNLAVAWWMTSTSNRTNTRLTPGAQPR